MARKTGELMGLARFAKSAAVAAVLSAVGASATLAATFDGIFSLSGSSFAEPGLVMQTSAQTGAMTFQLDTVGQSITLDLFDIWTNENRANGNNTQTDSLVADFTFASLGTSGAATGATTGHGGIIQYASLAWAGPVMLNFGNGGLLSIALNDANFAYGLFAFGRGQANGATVQATVTLLATPVPVPLPASGLALIAALGAGSIVARRRRAA